MAQWPLQDPMNIGGTDHIYWLVVFGHPSEKYEFVNWDDDIPNINGKIKNAPNHQPV